jgi:hypothetical protein
MRRCHRGWWLRFVRLSACVSFIILEVASPRDLPRAMAAGVAQVSCPTGAIPVQPGQSIQAMVDQAGANAVFCLKNGIFRAQRVQPRSKQSFYGEGQTILNGSMPVGNFRREGLYWVVDGWFQRGERNGQCTAEAPTCDWPAAVFIDDRPLVPAAMKDGLQTGQFYLDQSGRKLYLAINPAGHNVELTAASVAFDGTASDVLIRNLTIEKYASVAQRGAIQARHGIRWTIENCEIRLNSGAGIGVGTATQVHGSDIQHNGQLGIGGVGNDVTIEANDIWGNNTRGFDFRWEAGGVKLALSERVIFRGNHVHENGGPGLWCDIRCRDVLYEGNVVENNADAGIFHEISFKAIVRNNIVRENGASDRPWFWGPDILIAASRDVEVYRNVLTVHAGRCGIVLIDEGRRVRGGEEYQTRDNTVWQNDITFDGAPCAGGASDVEPSDANFNIITEGNNRFDSDVYRVHSTDQPARFVWGHDVFSWEDWRAQGLERNGRLIRY